jgi:hypothetical protein
MTAIVKEGWLTKEGLHSSITYSCFHLNFLSNFQVQSGNRGVGDGSYSMTAAFLAITQMNVS